MADATFSGAEGVYAFRKLLTTYSGDCIEVTAGGSAEDIGFNSKGELDVDALQTFCGANVGKITKWYDQSGNGNTLTPGTTGPTICEDGVVTRRLGEICADWSGGDYLEADIDPDQAQPGTVVLRIIDENNERRSSVFQGSADSVSRWQVFKSAANESGYTIFSGASLNSTAALSRVTANWTTIQGVFSGANSAIYQDGALIGSGNAGTANISSFRLGADTDGNQHNGFTAAAVLYFDDQSANASVIHFDLEGSARNISRNVLADGAINGGKFYGRASVEDLGNDVWVCAYREGSKHAVNDGTIELIFSMDHGRTWGPPNKFHDGSDLVGWQGYPDSESEPGDALGPGEPWLILYPTGELACYMWKADYGVTQRGTWVTRSSDGGKTWTTPSQVQFNTPSVDDDLIFATCDHYHHPTDGYTYIAGRIYSDQSGTNKRCAIWRTNDGGRSMEFLSYLSEFTPDDANEAGIVYQGGGTAFAFLRRNINTAMFKTATANDWQTASAATDVYDSGNGDFLDPYQRCRMFTLKELMLQDSWEDDRNIVVSCFRSDSPGQSFARTVGLLYSRDGGDSWAFMPLDKPYSEGGYGDLIYDNWSHEIVAITYVADAVDAANVVQYRVPVTDLFPEVSKPPERLGFFEPRTSGTDVPQRLEDLQAQTSLQSVDVLGRRAVSLGRSR
jgi:hypothetical protein